MINLEDKAILIHGSYDDYRNAVARDLVNAGAELVHTDAYGVNMDEVDIIIAFGCSCDFCDPCEIAEKHEITLLAER